ncbi:hypothetical protein [uncultured Gulosibacter sp.]|uniref:hypothetical protein n=1 Tax=uncultured Gulosibacter sp. TaxID=1339167 RepID=UPI00288C1149|nr:hypothetical protein [uncultured Gulosibacter sp.]
MRRQFNGLLVTAFVIVLLAGCAASDASETGRPTLMTATDTAAAEPTLPTLTEGTVPPEYEDEYLDLAVTAYLDYLNAALRVLEHKLDADALKDYALPSMQDDIDWFAEAAADHGPWKVEGAFRLENIELTNSKITDEYVRLQFIACQRDGEINISNSEHEHIRDRSKGDRRPMVVVVKGPINALKVEKSGLLGDPNPCEQ